MEQCLFNEMEVFKQRDEIFFQASKKNIHKNSAAVGGHISLSVWFNA